MPRPPQLSAALCRSLVHTKEACGSPFGQTPNCYPEDTTYQVIDDDYCAAGFASLYNVPEENTEILLNLAKLNTDLHAECSRIHVQVSLCVPARDVCDTDLHSAAATWRCTHLRTLPSCNSPSLCAVALRSTDSPGDQENAWKDNHLVYTLGLDRCARRKVCNVRCGTSDVMSAREISSKLCNLGCRNGVTKQCPIHMWQSWQCSPLSSTAASHSVPNLPSHRLCTPCCRVGPTQRATKQLTTMIPPSQPAPQQAQAPQRTHTAHQVPPQQEHSCSGRSACRSLSCVLNMLAPCCKLVVCSVRTPESKRYQVYRTDLQCMVAGGQQESAQDIMDRGAMPERETASEPVDDGVSFAAVIGPIIAVCLVIGACAAAAAFLKKRKLRREEKRSKKTKRPRVRVWYNSQPCKTAAKSTTKNAPVHLAAHIRLFQ